MFKLLDRQMIFGYLKAYLVCLVSILSLFIVVDLFANLDDATKDRKGLQSILEFIGKYYACKIPEIFNRLCETIGLLAAMFTVAWMQRNNELLPLLSAGVSTRRVVRPVLFASFLTLGLGIANQELLLPRIDGFLVERRQEGDREVEVKGAFDGNDVHLSGKMANRNLSLIHDFICVLPAKVGPNALTRLEAKEARWIPPGDGPRSGGWMLTGTTPLQLDDWPRKDILDSIVPGKFFLRTDADFDTVTRSRNWFLYVDTLTLLDELGRNHNSNRLAGIATMFHIRLTRPVLGMILVFMGLSIILRDHNRNIFISAGLCLILVVLFFTSGFVCQFLGNNDILTPALAAWLPVFVFGPLSFVMFDAVHT